MENLFQKLTTAKLENGRLPDELKLSSSGKFTTYYAPFEHVNPEAKVVICGITPGIQQASLAIKAAQDALAKGLSHEQALKAAKHMASFAGRMRANLVEMLDHVGLNHYLGIASTLALFGERSDLVHYTSALRNPVLANGKNYSGDGIAREDYLWQLAERGLREEIAALPANTVFVPLGPSVDAVFERLAHLGVINSDRVLSGLPHPSGANAERIAYFCERKPSEALSAKTNAASIDHRRDRLIARVSSLDSADVALRQQLSRH